MSWNILNFRSILRVLNCIHIIFIREMNSKSEATVLPKDSDQKNDLLLRRIFIAVIVLAMCCCVAISTVTAVVFYKNPSVKRDFQQAFSNFFIAMGELIAPKSPDAPAEEEPLELPELDESMYVLIMGVDEREDDFGRSDTIMVAQIDSINDRLALLSIPRDTRVSIRGGYDKINAAYAYGGIELAKNTVEDFLDLDVNRYFIFNTKNLTKMIDAIGGIDIDVEKRMLYEDPWDDNGGLYIDLKPGLQHMDGKTALTYVRFRDWEGDIGRVRRQQKFVHAVLEKLQSPEMIPRIPALVGEVYRSVQTDLSLREVLAIVRTVQTAREGSNFTTGTIIGDWQFVGDTGYLITNDYAVERVKSQTFAIPMRNLNYDYFTEENFDEFFLDELDESTNEQDEEEGYFESDEYSYPEPEGDVYDW